MAMNVLKAQPAALLDRPQETAYAGRSIAAKSGVLPGEPH
jgi:hypothetical protein